MFVPGNAGALCAVQKNRPVAGLLGGAQELEPNPRIELNPGLLRGVNIFVLKPLVIQRVALRLVVRHLSFLPAWLRVSYRKKTIQTSEDKGDSRPPSYPVEIPRDPGDDKAALRMVMTAPNAALGRYSRLWNGVVYF
jgi:hypothetical protein